VILNIVALFSVVFIKVICGWIVDIEKNSVGYLRQPTLLGEAHV
jgi:hypothetical protein